MGLLERDPGQILGPLDTPESQPLKAPCEGEETLLDVRRHPSPDDAPGLVDHACAVADQKHIGLPCGACHLERVEQGPPFGVAARPLASGFEMDCPAHHRGDPEWTRVGATAAVEIDLGQRASDQARTNVPALRTRRAAWSSISAHSPGATPAAGASIGSS